MTEDTPRPLRLRLRSLVEASDFDAAHALIDAALAATEPDGTGPDGTEPAAAGTDEDRFALLMARAETLARQGERSRSRAVLVEALARVQPPDARAEAAASGVLARLGAPVEAELAALRAVDLDPADWRGHAALAAVAAARGSAVAAVAHARRAVACAPDEPRAHLALAAVLRPLTSKEEYAAEAGAATDRALELGADPAEVRRPREGGPSRRSCLLTLGGMVVFVALGPADAAGTVGRLVLFALMGAALAAMAVIRVRRSGSGLVGHLAGRRQLVRRRAAAPEYLHAGAPLFAATVALVSMVGGFLSADGADGGAAPAWQAWLQLAAVPVLAGAGVLGTDLWLGRGTTRRTLAADPWTTAALAVSAVMVGLPAVLVLRGTGSRLFWTVMVAAQFGWVLAGAVLGPVASSRRRKRLVRPV